MVLWYNKYFCYLVSKEINARYKVKSPRVREKRQKPESY